MGPEKPEVEKSEERSSFESSLDPASPELSVPSAMSTDKESSPSSDAQSDGPQEKENEDLVVLLEDILPLVPTRCLRAGLHDPDLPLRFHVDELSASIAKGRVSVQVSRLAQICPEVFDTPRTPVEDVAIRLPLQKLIEQLGFVELGSRRSGHKSRPPHPAPSQIWAVAKPPSQPLETSGEPSPQKLAPAHAPNGHTQPMPQAVGGPVGKPEEPKSPDETLPPNSAATSPADAEEEEGKDALSSEEQVTTISKEIETTGPEGVAGVTAEHAAVPGSASASQPHTVKEPPPQENADLVSDLTPALNLSNPDRVPEPSTLPSAALPETAPTSPSDIKENGDAPPRDKQVTKISTDAKPDSAPAFISIVPEPVAAPLSASPPEPAASQEPQPQDSADPKSSPPLPSSLPIPKPSPLASGLASTTVPLIPFEPVHMPHIRPPAPRPPVLPKTEVAAQSAPPAEAKVQTETPAPSEQVTENLGASALSPEPSPAPQSSAFGRPILQPPPLFAKAGAAADTAKISAPEPTTVAPPAPPQAPRAAPVPASKRSSKSKEPASAAVPPPTVETPKPPVTLVAAESAPATATSEPVSMSSTAPQPPAGPVATSAPPIRFTQKVASASLSHPAKLDQDRLQAIFHTEELLDLPKVTQLAAALPGLSACLLVSKNETARAGQWPESLHDKEVENLCREFLQVTARLKGAGPVLGFTLQGEPASFTFFTRGEIYFGIAHLARGFLPGVREKLLSILECLQP